MASQENEQYWKESARLKDKNARRSTQRKASPGIRNSQNLSKKKEQ
jgi:hypothetical protein